MSVQETEIAKFSSFAIFPTHFSDFTSIEFYLETNSFVHLELLDIQGRTVKNLKSEYPESGDYYEDIFSEFFQMVSGVYLFKLKTDDI